MSQVTAPTGQTARRPAPVPPAGARGLATLPPPSPGQQVSDRRARAGAAVRALLEGSPGRLRLAGIGAVLSCLVFALLGAAAFQSRASALADAKADAAQLIRVQQIATEVVRADSLLTNSFPTPGAETAGQVADFDLALANAGQSVADAAAANPADGPELAQVSDALGQYRQYATSARIYNREGKQVALGYLRQAGAALRGPDPASPNLATGPGLLPTLDRLIKDSTDRVDAAYTASTWATVEMVGADVIALGGLVLVQVWLAKRSRRYLNLPLVAASGAVLVVLVAGVFVMAGSQSRATTVRDNSYKSLKALADARISVNAAKSDASISFLYQRTGGSSDTYRKDYGARTAKVSQSLQAAGSATPPGAARDFATWKAAADTLIRTDYASNPAAWQQAATGVSALDQPFNRPFQALDAALERGIDTQAEDVSKGLGQGNAPIVVLGWLALVVGLLAAVLSWAGIAQRLEDYR
jgi:hypothetical protein